MGGPNPAMIPWAGHHHFFSFRFSTCPSVLRTYDTRWCFRFSFRSGGFVLRIRKNSCCNLATSVVLATGPIIVVFKGLTTQTPVSVLLDLVHCNTSLNCLGTCCCSGGMCRKHLCIDSSLDQGLLHRICYSSRTTRPCLRVYICQKQSMIFC